MAKSKLKKLQIGGLQKLTLIDFPNCLATTVFLTGCNFLCPWCYSSELVLPEKIKSQPKIAKKDFFHFLKEKRKYLEGVVICGGEPTIHDNLPSFINKIKKLGFLVKLDTNGSNPEMLTTLLKKNLLDYIAMDLKAPLNDLKYQKAVGVKIKTEKIKKSIKIIKESKIDYEFRTTVVPGIHLKEDIIQIAKAIFPAKKYFLQNFKPEKTLNSSFQKIIPYSSEILLDIQKTITSFFDVCQIR